MSNCLNFGHEDVVDTRGGHLAVEPGTSNTKRSRIGHPKKSKTTPRANRSRASPYRSDRLDGACCTGGVDSRRVNAALQITSSGFGVSRPLIVGETPRQQAAPLTFTAGSSRQSPLELARSTYGLIA